VSPDATASKASDPALRLVPAWTLLAGLLVLAGATAVARSIAFALECVTPIEIFRLQLANGERLPQLCENLPAMAARS
jgi:hypothetical protein